MTIRVSIIPKTIPEGYDGTIQVQMQLIDSPGETFDGNFFWTISNPDLSPTNRNMLMRSGNEGREQSVCFDAPTNLARGQHPFSISGENGRASGAEQFLPDLATLTLNVNTAVAPSADGFNIAYSPVDSNSLSRGDSIEIVMSLRNPSDDNFVFRLTSDVDVFETTASTFTITGTEQVRTFLRVKTDATYESGIITIVPVNAAAMGLQALLTASGSATHGFTVVRAPAPSVDSFNIAFEPTDVFPGKELFVEMSMVNPSDHVFTFRLFSTVDVFEPDTEANYEFAIQGNETVRTYIRVREDAVLEPGVLRIIPVNANATAVGTELTAAGNEHPFLIVAAPVVVDDRVPSNINADRDTIRRYFESLLFVERFRLPSEAAWRVNEVQNHNLVLTNLRIEIDHDELYAVPFAAEGAIESDYIAAIDKYPGKSWIRLSIRPGASSQVALAGDVGVYRFEGTAFFQIFVDNNLPSSVVVELEKGLSELILRHKNKRRTEVEYANIRVSAGTTTFGIDAVSDRWSQSNISFPYTFDITV